MGGSEQVTRFREKLLTTREVSRLLGISEKELIEMTKRGDIPHYKVAGEFLRFRKPEIFKIKDEIQRKFNCARPQTSLGERVREFFYFNDFYILSGAVITVLLWYIFKG